MTCDVKFKNHPFFLRFGRTGPSGKVSSVCPTRDSLSRQLVVKHGDHFKISSVEVSSEGRVRPSLFSQMEPASAIGTRSELLLYLHEYQIHMCLYESRCSSRGDCHRSVACQWPTHSGVLCQRWFRCRFILKPRQCSRNRDPVRLLLHQSAPVLPSMYHLLDRQGGPPREEHS